MDIIYEDKSNQPGWQHFLLAVLVFILIPALSLPAFGSTRISVLISHSDIHEALGAFLQTMIVSFQWTTISTYEMDGQMDAGIKIADEIQKSEPDLVLAVGTTAALAAKEDKDHTFVKAGALLALSYKYDDIGKQAAEIAIR